MGGGGAVRRRRRRGWAGTRDEGRRCRLPSRCAVRVSRRSGRVRARERGRDAQRAPGGARCRRRARGLHVDVRDVRARPGAAGDGGGWSAGLGADRSVQGDEARGGATGTDCRAGRLRYRDRESDDSGWRGRSGSDPDRPHGARRRTGRFRAYLGGTASISSASATLRAAICWHGSGVAAGSAICSVART